MTAPERIWATGQNSQPAGRWWHDTQIKSGVEYIRADLASIEPQPDPRDEVIARLVEAATEALSEIEAGDVTLNAIRDIRAALAAAKAVQK